MFISKNLSIWQKCTVWVRFFYAIIKVRNETCGKTLTKQTTKLVKQSNGIEYLYDNEGVIGFKYTTTENDENVTNTYFYRKDIFGNVTHILDTNGATVVKYVYDAWVGVPQKFAEF